MLTDRVAALQAALDGLLAEDLVGLGRDELLDGLRGFESFTRRLPVADHALIAEVVERGLAAEVCEPSANLSGRTGEPKSGAERSKATRPTTSTRPEH
jgi:hypothetical protein